MTKDNAYFLDMLSAAIELHRLALTLSRTDFQTSRIEQLALLKLLEIVGEAARRISDEGKAAHPEISWRPINGMRNVLIHDYGNIDLDRIWSIIAQGIPILIAQLKAIVPPDTQA